MATTSALLQISDSILLEYQYYSKIAPLTGQNSSGILTIKNDTTDEIVKISYNENNQDFPKNELKNDISRTGIKIASDIWLRLDDTQPFENFIQASGVLSFTPEFQNFTQSYNIIYDRVRVYFISGFQFEDFPGLIVETSYVSRTNTKKVGAASQIILGSEQKWELASRPFIFSQRSYDRYVEFFIPSLQELTIPDASVPSSYMFDDPKYTEASSNYYFNSSEISPFIEIAFHQINNYVKAQNGQYYLYTTPFALRNGSQSSKFEIEKADQDILLAALIQESSFGDFFEYYPTYDEDFINEYVDRRNRRGDLIQVHHVIRVFEHLTTQQGYQGELMTSEFTQFQDFGFDQPLYFRPVLRIGTAIAATLEYECRILNRRDNTSTIRTGSVTIKNPAKYGLRLLKLDVKATPPIKIVNKIVENTLPDPTNLRESIIMPALYDSRILDNLGVSSANSTGVSTLSYEIQKISVSSETVLLNALNGGANFSSLSTDPNFNSQLAKLDTSAVKKSGVINKQGECVINLNKVNNTIRFEFYETSSTAVPSLMTDLIENDQNRMQIVFDNGENVIRLSSLETAEKTPGKFTFSIPGNAVRQLEASGGRNFYLVMNRQDGIISRQNLNSSSSGIGTDIFLYQGVFVIENTQDQLKVLQDSYKASLLDARIENIENLKLALENLTLQIQALIAKVTFSPDPTIALQQQQDLAAFTQNLQSTVLNTTLADELGTSQTDLLSKFQDILNKLKIPTS
jgi:hypothetical protein